jgi:cis-3-alkyl-4-acyloxetan-2-one decarboxylase
MLNYGVATSSVDWRQLYPFESHWHETGTGYGRMHYVDEGPADSTNGAASKALLFVHGNPTWSFHWRRLIAALGTSYRCIAPDHLGCGLSDRPHRMLRLSDHIDHLASLVSTLNLQRITLVAQDWGGAIGLATMLGMPERFDGIILFNTGAFPPRYIPWRIRACRFPALGRLAVQGANLFSRAALRMTLARRQRLEPAVASGYLAPYNSWANRRGVYGFVRDIPGRAADDTGQTLAAIERNLPSLADRPALLIWGMRDWCFRPDCLERFLEAWPHAEAHRLADVGHWVVEDAPEESLALVERFLATSAAKDVAGTLRVP